MPNAELCNRLVTVNSRGHRVLGFPVNIVGEVYKRRNFRFDLCFVFKYEQDAVSYQGNVTRIGRMFKALEEQSQILSKGLKDPVYFADDQNSGKASEFESALKLKKELNNGFTEDKYLKVVDNVNDDMGKMLPKNAPGQNKTSVITLSSTASLIQQIYQDLNNYSECMIPIDSANSVDIKLFPVQPPPPDLHASDVPLATVKLEYLVDSYWDPTMVKILPFINGINTIKMISRYADADFELTKRCIIELFHYKSIAILDVFQFSNCYAPTTEISNLLSDPEMAAGCQSYVVSAAGTFGKLPLRHKRASGSTSELETTLDHVTGSSPSKHPHPLNINMGMSVKSASPANSFSLNNNSQLTNSMYNPQKTKILPLPSKATLFHLYLSMSQNLSLKQWYTENAKTLEYIDIRRFVTFGILRGLIYRVRSYPLSASSEKALSQKSKNYNYSTFQVSASNSKESENTPTGDGTAVTGHKISQKESEDKFQSEDEILQKRQTEKDVDFLLKLLKNASDFDQICTQMSKPRKEITTLLNGIGAEWSIINS
ncbi:unnamed protein product [Ambrosiozyma monospora]|uniref:Unnamed protein product n=1 Tax=Ambrosiozyma monospora TaxID=43982 RepID=A0A9W7DEA4_AMBMO|nr:unnamed protein product [Ambrosiozyma monospora]